MKTKCKADFEKWLLKKDYIIKQFYEPKLVNEGFGFEFNQLPDSMKWGVMVDYYGEYDIEIEITKHKTYKSYWCYYIKDENVDWQEIKKSRHEARKEALKKACEIRNKQLE